MGDVEYIRDVLIPEFLQQFTSDNAEYPPERPLGAKAEWHGIHRKVGKLKAPLWEDKPWTGRESVRRMLLEIAGHAFLAVASLDEETSPEVSMQERTDDLTDVLRRNMSPESQAALRRQRAEQAGYAQLGAAPIIDHRV